jgi:phosphonatase-like hydrolase
MLRGSKLVKMVVCDMFGTIVKDNGAIDRALEKTFNSQGLFVTDIIKQKWQKGDKLEIIADTVNDRCNRSPMGIEHVIKNSEKMFSKELEKIYLEDSSCVELVDPTVLDLFDNLRMNNITVALNTNFSEQVQRNVMNHLSLHKHVDDFTSRDKVPIGRPSPHMIWQLMHDNEIHDPSTVVKIGDSVDDMREGKNANCGIVAGVLSGNFSRSQLEKYNPNVIFDTVIDLNKYMRRNFIVF